MQMSSWRGRGRGVRKGTARPCASTGPATQKRSELAGTWGAPSPTWGHPYLRPHLSPLWKRGLGLESPSLSSWLGFLRTVRSQAPPRVTSLERRWKWDPVCQ